MLPALCALCQEPSPCRHLLPHIVSMAMERLVPNDRPAVLMLKRWGFPCNHSPTHGIGGPL